MELKRGDSYFIPANYGNYKLKGNMRIILTNIEKYIIPKKS